MAKLFLGLIREKRVAKTIRGLTFEKAADYAPKAEDGDYVKGSDVPWLNRFAVAGGHAIISGDVKMRQKAHERFALYENGFVVLFFETHWGEWNFFQKSALMLHWWEIMVDKIRHADKGTFWVVPCNWPVKGGKLRNVSFGLAQLLKDNPTRATSPRKHRLAASLNDKNADERQQGFMDTLDKKSAIEKP